MLPQTHPLKTAAENATRLHASDVRARRAVDVGAGDLGATGDDHWLSGYGNIL